MSQQISTQENSDQDSTSQSSRRASPTQIQDSFFSKKIFEQQSGNQIKKDNLLQISEQELRNHNNRKDLWVCIENNIYDLTEFQEKHPGGKLTLEAVAGKDASEIFMVYHPKEVYSFLKNFQIGELKNPSKTSDQELIKDFKKLQEELIQEGLYKVSKYYYIKRVFVTLVLFGLAWYLQIQGFEENNIIKQLTAAFVLGFFFQQTAFIGHDCGHTAVFQNRWKDCFFGFFIGNLLQGISIGWWKDSHNTHHVIPNDVNFDPDIQHLPFFAVSRHFFTNIYSKYHERIMKLDCIAKVLVKYQHFLYYPVMGVARFFLYLQSCLHILGPKPQKCEFFWYELFFQTLFFVWYFVFFSYSISTKMMFVNLFLSHFIAGLLHVQITLSHFGMEHFIGGNQYTDELNYIDLQLKSTLDISNPPFLDWFHGGLQFQLAHHLFPRIPRHNLPIVRKKADKLLQKHNRQYNIKTFLEANIHTYKMLKQEAMVLQQNPNAKFTQSMLWDGINVRG